MAQEKIIVRVARMALEGEAVAKAEGSARVVFVAGGAPGDLCEVELVEAKSNFARARMLRLIEPGPERIAPPCPLHLAPDRPGPACGGCDWQHLDYAAQLKHKTSLVRDCVERIAKLKDVPVADTLPSPQTWAYRNKVMVPFGTDPSGKIIAGFYAAGSHQIVDFPACPIQPDLSTAIVLKVKEMARTLRWQPHDERRNQGWLRHVFVRVNSQGQALVAVVTRGPRLADERAFSDGLRAAFPQIVSLWHNVQPMKTSVILGPVWRRLWGAAALAEKMGPYTFMASPEAFLQVNTPAAALLYDAAAAFLADGGRRFSDLVDVYCGAGTLTVWLAKAADRVTGVEENRGAVRDAWKNAERNNARNVRFIAGKAEAVLPRFFKELPAGAAAVVDPPRAGLSVSVLRNLTHPSLRRIIYVSCNPATFARDAGYLSHSGFSLRRVQPVDLFPQTSHVELVGLFDRSGSKDLDRPRPSGPPAAGG